MHTPFMPLLLKFDNTIKFQKEVCEMGYFATRPFFAFEPVDLLICGLFEVWLHGFMQLAALLGMGAEGCK